MRQPVQYLEIWSEATAIAQIGIWAANPIDIHPLPKLQQTLCAIKLVESGMTGRAEPIPQNMTIQYDRGCPGKNSSGMQPAHKSGMYYGAVC